MDTKELKKVLAGIGVVGLLAGGGASIPGNVNAATGSGWGANMDHAVSAVTDAAGEVVDEKIDEAAAEVKEKVKDMKEDAAGSGWSGSKDGAGSTDDKDKADKPHSSGWSG